MAARKRRLRARFEACFEARPGGSHRPVAARVRLVRAVQPGVARSGRETGFSPLLPERALQVPRRMTPRASEIVSFRARLEQRAEARVEAAERRRVGPAL